MPVCEMNSSVGTEIYEGNHSKLFKMLHILDTALNNPATETAALDSVIDGLIDYMQNGLRGEEEAMDAYAYPGFAEHKREHDAFRSEVGSFLALVQFGSMPPASTVVEFLEDWFVTHIIKADREYGLFLAKNGLE